jgi:hypothetical protein
MNPREKLLDEIAAHLAEELGDLPTAAAIARLVGEEVLSWRTPEIDAREIKTILTFTFGNRMQPNGNRTPGPVNEALADVAVRLHRTTSAPVYAQWEVAEATGSRISPDRLFTIYPRRDERSEPRYLSTSGVVEEIVRRVGNPAALGTVGIVAFADHAWRCVATARRFGLAAGIPAGYAMPIIYDALSGQPWCRNRLAYLFHDIAVRSAERRDALIAQQPWARDR